MEPSGDQMAGRTILWSLLTSSSGCTTTGRGRFLLYERMKLAGSWSGVLNYTVTPLPNCKKKKSWGVNCGSGKRHGCWTVADKPHRKTQSYRFYRGFDIGNHLNELGLTYFEEMPTYSFDLVKVTDKSLHRNYCTAYLDETYASLKTTGRSLQEEGLTGDVDK